MPKLIVFRSYLKKCKGKIYCETTSPSNFLLFRLPTEHQFVYTYVVFDILGDVCFQADLALSFNRCYCRSRHSRLGRGEYERVLEDIHVWLAGAV